MSFHQTLAYEQLAELSTLFLLNIQQQPQIYSQFYPQAYDEIITQTYPQDGPDEKTMLSGDNPTATMDYSAISKTSTGISDTFPADSLILIPNPPTLLPDPLKLESGAESNLGAETGFESSKNTDALGISKTINKKVAGTTSAALTVEAITKKESSKAIFISSVPVNSIVNFSNLLSNTIFSHSLSP